MDGQRLLEHKDLGIAGELANTYCLLEAPSIYPEDLAEFYKYMLYHFGFAVELQNLGALSLALMGQQNWACREICKEKKVVLGKLDKAKVYLKAWRENMVREVL